MRKRKGFTLIELLIVVAIIAILAAIAVPNFLQAQTRAKVSRVKADQRSLQLAVEEYYIDNNTYPAYTYGAAGINAQFGPGAGCYNMATFRICDFNSASGLNMSLTTPVPHITSIPRDPFASTRGSSFAYYCDLNGWILVSFGPDTDESNDTPGPGDLISQVESAYNSNVSQPSITLIAGDGSWVAGAQTTPSFTYDSSNGSVSDGDIWKVKQ